MATLRTLVTKLVLDSRDAVKGLKAYNTLWKVTAKGVEASATIIERSADRAVAALQRMGDAAAVARGAAAGARAAGPSGGTSGRGGGQRSGGQSSPVIDKIVATGAKVGAAQAGLAAGSKVVNDAAAGLGKFATASDRARAKVADLTAQVARNREEMARLKRQAVETGDADGTLAARMRGLSAATLDATQKLAGARRELRGVEGGLIDAVKAAGGLRGALATAGGNLLAGITTRVVGGAAGAVGGAAQAAMDFEKAGVDIRKVARGADDTDDGFKKIQERIKETSKTLGVMPQEVAELTAALAPVFSGMQEKDTGAVVDLGELSNDVTKIGKAWDVTGAEAGKFFADTSRGLGTTTTETKALFGSINELGNQLGVKSKDVAEAMTRSAGVLKASGLSGETGAALNATLIAAGASADVAATGVRTFVARLEAGSAATLKQREAWDTLSKTQAGVGLTAESVGEQMAKGGKVAEDQILKVVKAIGELPKKDQLPTLIELFGSESIGSIGAAATATETLAKAFKIAGDEGRALVSVQEEYDRVSNTTAARVDALKANVAVLAIEFGEALLPHIDKVVEFLTSPEGKEWGKGAVESAVGAVTTLANAIGSVVSFFGTLSNAIGGAETAVFALGLAVTAMAGPWAGFAIIAGGALIKVSGLVADLISAIPGIGDAVKGVAGGLTTYLQDLKAKEFAGKLRDDDDVAYAAKQNAPQTSSPAGVEYGDRMAAMGPDLPPQAAGAGARTVDRAADGARFDELVRLRNASADGLAPAEAKELRSLSKSLNRAIPHKPGKGRTHKATKMDRQLAAIDPSVRGVLTRGGETDKGGDMKVADNALDRAVFGKANAANGLGGSGGGLGTSMAPNTTNHYTYITTNIEQAIDARGPGNSSDNLASAGRQVANEAAGAIRFTGADSLKASRLAGGVRRGPA